MSDQIPTLQTIIDAGTNAEVFNEVVTSSATETVKVDSTGKKHLTLTYLNQLFGGINVGDYVNGTVLDEVWEYAYNPHTGYGYKVKSKSSLPYTVDVTTYPDPEDDPNLKRVSDVNHEDVTKAQEELLDAGSYIYPRSGYLADGMTVPVGTTHLRVLVGGAPTIVSMSPVDSGVVSSLTESGTTIGSSTVTFNSNLFESIKTRTIYVTATGPTNLAAYPPIYDSLSGAMASITDNNYYNRYSVELLSGIHDAREILLKDYVDIIRSPLAGSEVIIEHNFDKTESFKNRDIFKTCLTPYDATDNFPIRCKLKGLIVRGINLNYALHGDFNESPLIDIQADDCIFFNGNPASDALTAEYGMGLGVYGRQRYEFNRCLFYGRYDATQTDKTRQQGSGWVVHNRLNQSGPCSVTFNDCKSLKGWYGGRIVDYASGHEDIISINGGVLLGEFADLLCFSLAEAVTAPSITVVGSCPVKTIRTTQLTGSGTYECSFPVVMSGFSGLYRAETALEIGDLVRYDAFQRSVGKAVKGTRYRYKLGVVLNNVDAGGRVAVQEHGVAQVKFTPASISSNTEISNSSTVDGEIQIATTGDGVIGATRSSTSFSSGETPGLAWISLGYSGTKV